MYLDHLQNWLVYSHSLVIFLILALFWQWNGSNLGFPDIFWRTHWVNGLKFCMLMYPDHLQNWLDYGYSLSIFLVLVLLWLSETGQIRGFRAFWSCSVDFPHYDYPLTETGHIWAFYALSGEHVGVNVKGGGGIFPMLCVEFCLVCSVGSSTARGVKITGICRYRTESAGGN